MVADPNPNPKTRIGSVRVGTRTLPMRNGEAGWAYDRGVSNASKQHEDGPGHEARLAAAGIILPEGYPSAGLYVKGVLAGDLLHIGGHGPVGPEGRISGKVGGTVDLDRARYAARLTGLQLLASARSELGTLDRVVRVVKVFGMVNSAPGFNRTPEVIDGCSELFHEVFGEAGIHTRSAVGMAELPFDIPVEIECILQVVPA